MVGNEIKSILRNKLNIIYIIVFIIVALITNIAININSIIDKYYDNEFNKLIDSLDRSEIENSMYMSLEEYITEYRTIGLTLATPLDDETIEEIKKIDHVQEVKQMEFLDNKIWSVNRVVVDDWKNCSYVQKELKKLGLDNYINDIRK